MSADTQIYAFKLHSAARYHDLAFAVKAYSTALYGRIESYAKQDEKMAALMMDGVDGHEQVDAIVLLPLQPIDDIDAEPIEVAFDAVQQIIENETYFNKIATKYERGGFSDIAKNRCQTLKLIIGYMKEGSMFVQAQGPAIFECSACGWWHWNRNPPREGFFAPEECPICGAAQAAFVRHHEIGGW